MYCFDFQLESLEPTKYETNKHCNSIILEFSVIYNHDLIRIQIFLIKGKFLLISRPPQQLFSQAIVALFQYISISFIYYNTLYQDYNKSKNAVVLRMFFSRKMHLVSYHFPLFLEIWHFERRR